jgi:hypothetical protein
MSDEESPVNFHKTAREKAPKGLELDTQLPWYMLPLFTTTTISVFSLRRRSITCSAEVEVGTQRGGPLAIESWGASSWKMKMRLSQENIGVSILWIEMEL